MKPCGKAIFLALAPLLAAGGGITLVLLLSHGNPEVLLVSVDADRDEMLPAVDADAGTGVDAGPRPSGTVSVPDGKAASSRGAKPDRATAGEGVPLRLDVLLPDGNRPASATVTVLERGGASKPWSPANPVLSFRPGTRRLIVKAGEDDLYRSGSFDVELSVDVEPEPVTVRLSGGRAIRGRVLLPEGLEPPSVRVWLLRFLPGHETGVERLVDEGGNGQVFARDGYRFVFRHLKAGTYLLGAAWERKEVVATSVVQVGEGFTEAEIRMPPLDPRGFVAVKVFGPDGEALDDVRVSTEYRDGSRVPVRSGKSIRKEDGARLAPHAEPRGGDDSRDGRHVVKVVSRAHGRKEVAYRPGIDREVTVRFEAPAVLKASVAGYAGSGYAGKLDLDLEARDGVPAPGRSPSALTPEGTKTFGPLAPGGYDLVLSIEHRSSSGRRRAHPVKRVPVDLASGRREISVSIPPLHSVTLVVKDPPDRAWFHLEWMNGEGGGWKIYRDLEAGGKVTFTDLPAGTYEATFTGGVKSGVMDFSLPGPSTLAFEGRVIDALRVDLSSTDGTLARAGFLDGDLVVGVDGKAFENRLQMMALFKGTFHKTSAVMTVLRAGAELEIEINPQRFMDTRSLGGRFEPDAR